MSDIAGYERRELLHEGRVFRVFRAIRAADGATVILKIPRAARPQPRHIARLRNEHEIARALDGRFVIRPIELISLPRAWALVLEDIGGTALSRWLGEPMPVERFLALALQIAEALAYVHGCGIVHRDIKPQNLIADVALSEVRINDFGVASLLPREQQALEHLAHIEGSLAYMAPEQTGRMNRGVDARSDLYALGVTFYELLAGRLPFRAADPLEWVHCHVAREPDAPSSVCAGVPEVLSQIVLKLLRKNAEDRYQSAYGLAWDLQRVLAAWRAGVRRPALALGERDATDRFQLPQKLYGREAELRALLAGFERVVKAARPELLLVSGYSGIGKSSLVMELQRPVVRERGFFISGKFDQYQRNIPYATVARALRGLVSDLLAESEERLGRWREHIQTAAAGNGQLLVDLIPEVELVIGPQRPAPALPPAEAQRLFNVTVHRFLSVFSKREHPFVLFVDDLQWIDGASLSLLRSLLADDPIPYFLLVGAYRDNEVDAAHPLMATLRTLRDRDVHVTEIALAPLGAHETNQLLADTLQTDEASARALSLSVLRKTGGNPFFVRQLLLRQHLDGLIQFRREAARWAWDLEAIEASGVTDNVVDLTTRRLRELDVEAQEVLQIAACLGSTFDLKTLSTVCGRSPSATLAAVRPAISADIVVLLDQGYKLLSLDGELGRDANSHLAFTHDRIQQAAYDLIPDAERKPMHLRVGRALLRGAPDDAERRRHALFIAHQLNRAIELVVDPAERLVVARLNLVAAQKAKASSAYESAAACLKVARECADEACWQAEHAFMFELHRESAEIESVNGRFEAAEELAWQTMRRARSALEKVELYKLLIEQRTMIPDHLGALELGREALALLDVDLPLVDLERLAAEELAEAKRRLGGREIASLIALPVVEDPRTEAVASLLVKLITTSYQLDADLWQITTAKLVSLSLARGNVADSSFGYAAFGNLLGSRLGEYRAGYEFGLLALRLCDKLNARAQKCIVSELFAGHINHWSRHIRTSYDIASESYVTGLEVGHMQYASYANGWRTQGSFYQGSNLASLLAEVASLVPFASKVREGVSLAMFQALRAAAVNLSGERRDRLSLDTDEMREEALVDECERTHNKLSRCLFYVHKMMVLYLYGEHDAANEAAARAEHLLPSILGAFASAQYVFYKSLILAALVGRAIAADRAGTLAQIGEGHAQMTAWSDCCPDNFLNKSLLIEAELARLAGRRLDAMHLYQEAIHAARRSGFIHEEALAYELGAHHYMAEGFQEIAELHLRQARACYARWGAGGKVRALDRAHPGLTASEPFVGTATCTLEVQQLDFLAVARAAQSISRELSPPRVHETLMRTVIEHAGAQRGYLVTTRGSEFLLLARGELAGDGIEIGVPRVSIPLADQLPLSVLQYVQRMRKHLLLDDASAASDHAADPYILRARPRSVLCAPIERQGELVALLYLENTLAVGAFTPSSLTALQILASQAAISLENATLYSSLEDSQRKLQSILDNASAGIYVKDLAGRFVLVNHRLEKILALRGVEIIGKTDHDFFPKEHADAIRTNDLRVLTSGAPLEWEEDVPQSDGIHTYFSVKFPIRDRAGVPYAVGGISTDITERKRAEADRLVALECERAALASREEFVTLAAHELRTPLTPIKLLLGALSRRVAGTGEPKLIDAVNKVSLKARKLEELTETLLDFARVADGKLKLRIEQVDLAALVREVAATFQEALAASGSSLRLHIDEPVVGSWDGGRIEQVVTNLLSNAAKYGGGKPIEVTVARDGDRAVLVIADQGIGIPPEKHAEIFDRFSRGVSATAYGGFGLGLYLARQMVESHGGRVDVRSAPGEGASFRVELPLRSTPSDRPSRSAAGTAALSGEEVEP